MESTLEQALAQLEASADLETFFQTSFVLLKILQNIVSAPEDDKYRRIRRASKLLSQIGAEDVLRTVGFKEEGDFLVCSIEDDALERLVEASRFIVSYRRRYNELSAWEIPTGSLTFNERVGKGKFGEVYRGSWDLKPVAIKTLRPKCEEYAVEQFRKEANIMRQCKHTNVLLLQAVCLFVEPSYLVLDLMKCCYLDLLREGALVQKEILDHITQVAAGVEYLHHLDILHCDIAARNILLDFHGVLKISDFGMARFDQTPECNAALHPGVFPTRWTAPEVFTRGTLSKHSDVWSFGISFYEFVTAGGVPYAEFTNKDTKQKVLEGYRLEQPADCPDKFYEIMMKCWEANPGARPTITNISESLLSFKAERAETLRSKIHLSQTSLESTESTPSPLLEVQEFSAAGLSSRDKGDFTRQNSTPGMKKSKSRKMSMHGVKIDKLLCVYTMLVSPFHSQVILRVKSKQKASDVVTLVLKKVDKDKADPSMFALVEVFDSEGSETRGMSRYLGDKEQPLVVKRAWTKRGRFFLCNRVGSSSDALLDALNVYLQQSDNVAKMQYKTRGYLIKFDEYVGGTKGRNVSRNWSRYWTLLDGSTMLFYKDEEDEEGEPLIHLSVKGCCVEPASDYTKKKGVLRLTTENGDRYLLHSSNKDDMYRWVEAVHSVRLDPASVILEKFGSGEVLKSGFLNVTCHFLEPDASEEPLGRNWFVLKDQHLSYFRQGERLVAIDFNSCVKILVRTPSIIKDYDKKRESSSSLLSFGMEVILSDSKFWMKPDTPGEQEEWLAAFEKALTPIGKAEVISLVEPEDVFQEQESDIRAAPAIAADSFVRFRSADGFQPLPRLSEEDDIRPGPTSPPVQVGISSVDTAELARSPVSPIPEIEGISKSSSSDSVIIKLQRSLSQRKGGGYSVRTKMIKAGLDESVVYGPDSSLSVEKNHEKLSLPGIDELPPPPESVVVPNEVADLPSPPDELPPPPPPDFDQLPPSLPVKPWRESPEFLSSVNPPSVDRQTKPGRHRAQTTDSSSAAEFHGDGDYVRMERFERSQSVPAHHRQSSDEYVRMHKLSNGTAGQGLVIDDPNYVAMAPHVGSQPIHIDKSYVKMAAISAVAASGGQMFATKRTSPLLGRRTATSSHERQDSLDGGTPGVLLYPSHSPARTPSPTSSPKALHNSHYRRGDSSVGSTPGSSTPSTPQPFATDDQFRMPKGPKPDLFSSPRRTIAGVSESHQTGSFSRELPAAAGVGYVRVGTVNRQASSPSMISTVPYSRQASSPSMISTVPYSRQTSVSPPEDIPRTGSFTSVTSDQYTRERSDSMLSRSSTGSQRSQSSLSGSSKAKPLPAGWKSNAGTNGRLYYYNSATGQRTWHINEVWASVRNVDYSHTSMAPGWEAELTSKGQTYYYHKETKRTTWNIMDTWRS